MLNVRMHIIRNWRGWSVRSSVLLSGRFSRCVRRWRRQQPRWRACQRRPWPTTSRPRGCLPRCCSCHKQKHKTNTAEASLVNLKLASKVLHKICIWCKTFDGNFTNMQIVWRTGRVVHAMVKFCFVRVCNFCTVDNSPNRRTCSPFIWIFIRTSVPPALCHSSSEHDAANENEHGCRNKYTRILCILYRAIHRTKSHMWIL